MLEDILAGLFAYQNVSHFVLGQMILLLNRLSSVFLEMNGYDTSRYHEICQTKSDTYSSADVTVLFI